MEGGALECPLATNSGFEFRVSALRLGMENHMEEMEKPNGN